MGLKYNDVRIETVKFFEGLQNPKMSDDLHKLSCYVDRHEEVHTNPSLLSGNTQIHYPHTHTHTVHIMYFLYKELLAVRSRLTPAFREVSY